MKRDWRNRAPPARSPKLWAREFVAAFEAKTGFRAPFRDLEKIAASNVRLRERIPANVVSLTVQSAAAAEIALPVWLRMARRYPGLLTVSGMAVKRSLNELRQLLGASESLIRIVQSHPVFLCYARDTLRRRTVRLRTLAGMASPAWRQCVRRCPGLLTAKPETFERRLRDQRRVLALTKAEYKELLIREPRILLRSAKAIGSFIKGLESVLGLSAAEARALVIKAPKLLHSGLIGTMNRNLDTLAKGFEVEKPRLVAAVKIFPPLAYQKPDRLIEAMGDGSRRLGVNESELVEAVLRAPSLLARRSEGWGPRMRLVRRIARCLGAELTAGDVIASFPAALTYGKSRLLQRYAMAKLGLWTWNWQTLLSFADSKARARLLEYFEAHDEHGSMRHALQRRGLL